MHPELCTTGYGKIKVACSNCSPETTLFCLQVECANAGPKQTSEVCQPAAVGRHEKSVRGRGIDGQFSLFMTLLVTD